jgi:hypothetical protein
MWAHVGLSNLLVCEESIHNIVDVWDIGYCCNTKELVLRVSLIIRGNAQHRAGAVSLIETTRSNHCCRSITLAGNYMD